MNKTLIESFKKGELAVNCKTENEAKKFIKWCYENNMEWAFRDDSYTYFDNTDNICYNYKTNFNGHLAYSNYDFYKIHGYKIISFEEMFTFTKNNLKTGMRVKLRNDNNYIVMLDYETKLYGKGIFVNENGFVNISSYKCDLSHRESREWDVLEVYKIDGDIEILNKNAVSTLIWKREEVKEMTVNEISEILGYKVKII